MARGHAVFHQPRIVVEHTVAEDVEAEEVRAAVVGDPWPRCDCEHDHGL